MLGHGNKQWAVARHHSSRPHHTSTRGTRRTLRNIFVYTVQTSTTTTPFVSHHVSDSKKTNTHEPTKNNHSVVLLQPDIWEKALIPHRPALSQVLVVGCVAFSIAVLCGVAISCVIYRLVQAEGKQQLARLYSSVEAPLLGAGEAGDGAEAGDESSQLLPEGDAELGAFIQSVIKSKRRKDIEKMRLREAQVLGKKKKLQNASHSSNTENS
ncbi:uncharacterized protein C19orf18 homolog isoform X2 [Tamandua tetradactyla]|uniref:uncharacterized protein C19orf18 homolog isoform X2 n=1 Tax=Tamandua tetradactyla TaxID=48850 RepID=UPI004053CCA5